MNTGFKHLRLFLIHCVIVFQPLMGYQQTTDDTHVVGRNHSTCGNGVCDKNEDCGTCFRDCCQQPSLDYGVCPDGVTTCTVDSDCKTCRKSGETCVTQGDCSGKAHTNQCRPVPDGTGFCNVFPIDGSSKDTTTSSSTSIDSKPIRVIVLTGQNNAQGFGFEEHLDALIQGIPGTPSLYDLTSTYHLLSHLKDSSTGLWNQRDDVYITYHSASSKTAAFDHIVEGQLSAVGYGSKRTRFGPEVGLGWKLGDLLEDGDQQIFIVKVAWGWASLHADFRPPSSGTSEDALTEPAEGFGWAYHAVVNHVKETLNNLDNILPNYDPEVGYELSGLVYFQGFNDVIQMKYVDEYQMNLSNLVSDLRKGLNKPDLNIVIGELGMQGPLMFGCPKHTAALCSIDPLCSYHNTPHYCDRVSKLRAAQQFVAENDENIALAETGIYNYGHIKDPSHPQFKAVWGNNQSHHYFANADTYYYIGESMADAMYELLIRDAPMR